MTLWHSVMEKVLLVQITYLLWMDSMIMVVSLNSIISQL